MKGLLKAILETYVKFLSAGGTETSPYEIDKNPTHPIRFNRVSNDELVKLRDM